MILSLYAGMLRAGIAMRDADETELGMYLEVLAHVTRREGAHGRKSEAWTRNTAQGKKPVVELRHGYIDDFWG